MQSSLNKYIIRISAFLLVVLIAVIFLYPILQNAFLSNIYINLIILCALIFGIVFNFYNLSKLNLDYNALANFNIHKSPQIFNDSRSSLKNLFNEIREVDGRFSFKSSQIDKILETGEILI